MSAFSDACWRGAMRVGFRLQLLWWRVRRPVIEGSYVAVWHDREILLIRNSYRRSHSLPAGGLQRRETPEQAAVRELAEEVGIEASIDELQYRGKIVTEGLAEDHAHMFELHRDQRPQVRIDRREVIWAEFVAPGDALARGLVPPVKRYLEALAAETAASNEASSRSMRR